MTAAIKLNIDGVPYTIDHFPCYIGNDLNSDIYIDNALLRTPICIKHNAADHTFVVLAHPHCQCDGISLNKNQPVHAYTQLLLGETQIEIRPNTTATVIDKKSSPWKIFTSFPAIFVWVLLSFFLPLLDDYLNTNGNYIFNWSLFFTVILSLAALTWITSTIIHQLTDQSVFKETLGIIAFIYAIAHVLDWIQFYYNAYFNHQYFILIQASLLCALTIIIFKQFIQAFSRYNGKALYKITSMVILPCLLLFSYQLIPSIMSASMGAEKHPQYHQQLNKISTLRPEKKIQAFFKQLN